MNRNIIVCLAVCYRNNPKQLLKLRIPYYLIFVKRRRPSPWNTYQLSEERLLIWTAAQRVIISGMPSNSPTTTAWNWLRVLFMLRGWLTPFAGQTRGGHSHIHVALARKTNCVCDRVHECTRMCTRTCVIQCVHNTRWFTQYNTFSLGGHHRNAVAIVMATTNKHITHILKLMKWLFNKIKHHCSIYHFFQTKHVY